MIKVNFGNSNYYFSPGYPFGITDLDRCFEPLTESDFKLYENLGISNDRLHLIWNKNKATDKRIKEISTSIQLGLDTDNYSSFDSRFKDMVSEKNTLLDTLDWLNHELKLLSENKTFISNSAVHLSSQLSALIEKRDAYLNFGNTESAIDTAMTDIAIKKCRDDITQSEGSLSVLADELALNTETIGNILSEISDTYGEYGEYLYNLLTPIIKRRTFSESDELWTYYKHDYLTIWTEDAISHYQGLISHKDRTTVIIENINQRIIETDISIISTKMEIIKLEAYRGGLINITVQLQILKSQIALITEYLREHDSNHTAKVTNLRNKINSTTKNGFEKYMEALVTIRRYTNNILVYDVLGSTSQNVSFANEIISTMRDVMRDNEDYYNQYKYSVNNLDYILLEYEININEFEKGELLKMLDLANNKFQTLTIMFSEDNKITDNTMLDKNVSDLIKNINTLTDQQIELESALETIIVNSDQLTIKKQKTADALSEVASNLLRLRTEWYANMNTFISSLNIMPNKDILKNIGIGLPRLEISKDVTALDEMNNDSFFINDEIINMYKDIEKYATTSLTALWDKYRIHPLSLDTYIEYQSQLAYSQFETAIRRYRELIATENLLLIPDISNMLDTYQTTTNKLFNYIGYELDTFNVCTTAFVPTFDKTLEVSKVIITNRDSFDNAMSLTSEYVPLIKTAIMDISIKIDAVTQKTKFLLEYDKLWAEL